MMILSLYFFALAIISGLYASRYAKLHGIYKKDWMLEACGWFGIGFFVFIILDLIVLAFMVW